MRIQILTQSSVHYKSQTEKIGAWHRIARELENEGHEIDFILKKELPFFMVKHIVFKPDVLVVNNVSGILAIVLKKIKLIRCPILFGWQDYYHEVMGRKWGVAKVALMQYFIGENVDIITTPSPFIARSNNLVGLRTKLIQHGVPDYIKAIKPKKLPPGLKFIYVGEMSQCKRTDSLIQACRNKNCTVYLIGNLGDTLFDHLFTKADNLPKNIKYLGNLPHEEAIAYIKGCDVGIVTADQDSSLKLYEYIACGKPVLALKGRSGYILDNMINAVLCDDFSDGIDLIIRNKNDLVKHLSKNIKKIKSSSWHENALQQLESMKQIVYESKN